MARSWIVGSEPACDLVIEQSTVSSRHCRILQATATSTLWIEDLGSTNGTFVNGTRLAAGTKIPITATDQVTLGRGTPLAWPAIQSICGDLPAPADRPDAADNEPQVLTIGRDADNDIVLDYPTVSGRHARIVNAGGQALLEDLGSTNGTGLGPPYRRIAHSSPITSADTAYFGSLPVPAQRLLQGQLILGLHPHVTVPMVKDRMILGRAPDCDRVLDYPMVSSRHARLTRAAQGIVVEDLGSTNGTFVNGQRIAGSVEVAPGDVIGLGSYTFTLAPGSTLEQRDHRGNVNLEASDVAVDVSSVRLIEGITLTLYPSELTGLMGPSGAGKTTLLGTLSGYTPPSRGAVYYNGHDLYQHYDLFRTQIGYVPQDDIMHRELTVREALYFTARLRLPVDTSDTEIDDRIHTVITDLGLSGTEDVLIGSPEKKGISGGQRKRVNIAMELLTDPSVLLLDEPTSGLSSQDALMVLRVLRRLADQGKTILLTLHQPGLEAYRLLDNLAMVSSDRGSGEPGRLVYFGRAYPEAIHFFNPGRPRPEAEPGPDELLAGLDQKTTREWDAAYAASPIKRRYVDERQSATQELPVPSRRSAPPWHPGQILTLVRRTLAVKRRDTWNTAILLLQAPIIAALLALVFKDTAMPTVVFLMAMAALWFGCSNAAREVVGEWAIYRRERMINLSIVAYLVSKLAVLGLSCALQCAILLGIVYLGCGLSGSWSAMFSLLLLAALVGMACGLMISALARTSEAAIALVPLALLPMVILGGIMRPVHEMDDSAQLLAQAMPTRWAFEGLIVLEARGQAPSSTSMTMLASEPDTAAPVSPAGGIDPNYYFPVAKRHELLPIAATLGEMLMALLLATAIILRQRD